MKRELKGFMCKNCNKPFYLIVDEPEYIADEIKQIRAYKKRGFDFIRIDEYEKMCSCGNIEGKK